MPDSFPLIPTQYAKGNKRSFTNDDLVARKPLSITIEQSPALRALYEDDGIDVDQLLADAHQTLDETAPTAQKLGAIGGFAEGQRAAGAEQSRLLSERNKDVANTAIAAGSFLPGPVGIASRAASSAQGAYDIATEGPNIGNVLQASASAFDAVPAIRALRNAPKPTGAGAKGPFSAYPRQQAPVTESSAAQPASLAALSDDAVKDNLIGEIDLSDAINSISEPPLSPAAVAQARAAERFGKTYRSERTAPQAKFAGVQEPLVDGDPALDMFDIEIAPGQFSTGAGADDVLRRQAVPDETAMRRIISSLFGEKAPASVSRMTAQEALMDDSTIGLTKAGKPITASSVEQNNPLFGGASSRQFGSGIEAGEFVRPKNRTPIGQKPRKSWIPASWDAFVKEAS